MGKRSDAGAGDEVAAPARLTPIDIQQKEFRDSRFGGYKMRDVDEFLDQITDSFGALTAEVERLRAGGGGAVVGSPDLDDVARQADELIARARADAARITAEARASGAAVAAVSASGPQDRSAVNAFISREREFLQSLAGLVQEHAETVKGMAKSTRAAARPTPSEPAASAEPAAADPGAADGSATAADPAPREPASTPTAATAAGAATAAAEAADVPDAPERAFQPVAEPEPTRVPESEATVRIDDPAPASARSEGDAEGDRSLRELFWGED